MYTFLSFKKRNARSQTKIKVRQKRDSYENRINSTLQHSQNISFVPRMSRAGNIDTI